MSISNWAMAILVKVSVRANYDSVADVVARLKLCRYTFCVQVNLFYQ